ncbi:Cytosolic sulfotransferase [Thalictrum thalictroides]|uniref:Sulfotransferase n=1 Tax=Thalictrum thalictroides TaxID=46969 RepID=A0A7J6WM23_THATH|nr:Cytosolic sulfotransferase [Thalictrum thalictroides]
MDCPQEDLPVIHSTQRDVLPPPSEFQELLGSLPTRKDMMNALHYCYNGFWFCEAILEGTTTFQQNFQAQDTDIILVTAPKSGTTWLKSLVFSITCRLQYKISDKNHPLVTTNPHGLIPFFEFLYGDNKSLHMPVGKPRLLATHLPYTLLPESIKTSKCKIIYLCRNPRDTFVSMWHFRKKILLKFDPSWQFPSIEESLERFCEGVSKYGPFWEQILQFWKLSKESPEKVLFLKYEDLKGDIIAQCKNIADYLNCSFSSEEENEGVIEDIAKFCSFEHLSNLEVNKSNEEGNVPLIENNMFFRKGEIGDWKNLLTTSMAEKLDQLVEQKLHGSGLKLN